jgi:hypothetical protein
MSSALLVVDASGLRRLADRSSGALALQRALQARRLWPPSVPAVVLADALTGDDGQDRSKNRFLLCCDVVEEVPLATARRAAWLRTAAGRGSAADALLVAMAEPGGAVLTGGRNDIEALALFAEGVMVERA